MEIKNIKQSLINTFDRVGIDYKTLATSDKKVEVYNRFGGGSATTTEFIAYLIKWVYQANDQFDQGTSTVRLDDFDRIRYFIMDQDQSAYMTCLD